MTIDTAGSADAVDLWRDELATAFAGLLPERIDATPTLGSIDSASLGQLRTYRVSGTPQLVRRTRGAVRHEPTDAFKVCIQIRGRAIVHQGEQELVINPGQLGVYDTGRAYDLRLEGDWECAVMVFPPVALQLPNRWVGGVMQHVHEASSGPGTVLTSFIDASLNQRDKDPERTGATLRFADAGLQLLASALTISAPPQQDDEANQALRLTVLDYLRHNIHEPELSHGSVAAAHGMSARTLDRLFETEPSSVTATIRDIRLDGSRRDLLDPRAVHVSVGAIAARWCFADAAHFSRLYKRKFGSTPSAERAGIIKRNR